MLRSNRAKTSRGAPSAFAAGVARLASRRGLGLAIEAGLSLALSMHAAAQTSGGDNVVIEEIVVTAQKRQETVQTVPLSVSVISGEQIEALHATQLQDYIAYVPDVIVDPGGAPGINTISIRGLNPMVSATMVATYVDDTPIGSSGGWTNESGYSLDLMPYDLERVEILLGPQGTLYGANSMGGLLKYVTRAPRLNQFEGRIGGDVFGIDGAHQAGWGARMGFNVPLIEDTLAMRISGYKHQTPGYIDNPERNRKGENATDEYGGRVSLQWQLSPDLSIKSSAMVQRIIADGLAIVDRPLDGGAPLGGNLTYSHPLADSFSRDLHYYSATVNWHLPWADLVSATSYSQVKILNDSDFTSVYGDLIPLLTGGAVATGLSAFDTAQGVHRTTEELRLVSPSGGRLEWLVGAYYNHEIGENQQRLSAQGPDFQPVVGLDPLVIASIPSFYKEIAAFTNETLKITERFDVSAGVRWAKNTQTYVQELGGALEPAGATPGASQEHVVTYAVSPRFKPNQATMLYLRVATGYRPGGPNVALAGIPPQVNSDRTRNYEAGIKATLDEAHAVVDAAVFRTDWTDMQVLLTSPAGIGYFANAKTARTQGVELATTSTPSRRLRLGFNAAYLDAKLTADVPAIGFIDGERLPSSPKWTASSTADYSMPAGPYWTASAGAGIRYVSTRLATVAGTTPAPINETSYSPVDLHAGLLNSSWNISLYIRNTFNQKRYLVNTRIQDVLGQNPAFIQSFPLEPRTIGLSVDRTF